MAESYGFKIDVEGNAIKNIQAIDGGLDNMARKGTKNLAELGIGFQNVASIASGMLAAMGVSFGLSKITQFVSESREAFDKYEESLAKINAALLSTKDVSGLTEDQLVKDAKALSQQVLFPKSAIMDAQSMLLTFTSIHGAIFEKAIPAITDFATRFKMELPEAANLVGKALNDPLKGLTRLQRQGVVFSEQQKEQIKFFMQTGQIAKAQGIILNELGTEFGGLAKAMTKTDAGKLEMASKQLGEIKLRLGELISKFEVALIPVFTKLVNGLKAIYHFVKDNITIFEILGAAIAGFIGYMIIAGTVTKIWTATQWLLNAAMTANPIGLIIAGIAALVTTVAILWNKFEGFRAFWGGMWAEMKKIFDAFIHGIVDHIKIIYHVFTGQWGKIGDDVKKITSDFQKDVLSGWKETWQAGAKAGAESKFRFGTGMNLGGESEMNKIGKGGTQAQASAIQTSNLTGAKGGLGEAKVVNVHIDTMQKIDIAKGDGKDVINRSQSAIELLIRAINNLSYSQSGTM